MMDDDEIADQEYFVGTPVLPTDPKKIRQRIKSYERKLQQEKRLNGAYDDGYGKRLLLGPLYMLAGDLDGALAHFDWYAREFSGDGGEPYQSLMWALALHRAGRDGEAFNKLYQTMFANLYLIPHLLGDQPKKLPIWHGSNFEWLNYALALPPELKALWSSDDLTWARSVYQDERVAANCAEYIEIQRQLKTAPIGPKRHALIEAESALSDFRF